MTLVPPRAIIRRSESMRGMEAVLGRAGFELVAGADEAGRGACAGPLVAAACVLPAGRRGEIAELADSKLLTEKARERVYSRVRARAVAMSVVVISAQEVDAIGVHVANVQALRRAVSQLHPAPTYTLTDGFPVDGLASPGLAVWKGDQVASCVAAASVLAKVTRDRLMVALHSRYPQYGFDIHKGYCTPGHDQTLAAHGPCPEHRRRYVNVRRHEAGYGGGPPVDADTRVDPDNGRFDLEEGVVR